MNSVICWDPCKYLDFAVEREDALLRGEAVTGKNRKTVFNVDMSRQRGREELNEVTAQGVHKPAQKYDEEGMMIYPNPVTSEFQISNIKSKIDAINIYNVLGSCVQKLTTNNQQQTSLNVSDLAKGIYFVEVKTKNETYIRKFVKE